MSSAVAENFLIPASALAELRGLNTSTLPHTCYVFRPVKSRGPGGVTRITHAFDVTIPCRLAPVRADERIAADQPVPGREWTVVFAVNPPVSLDTDVRLVIHGETDGEPWWRTMRIIRVPLERAFRTQTKVGTSDMDAAEFPVFVAEAASVEVTASAGAGGMLFLAAGAHVGQARHDGTADDGIFFTYAPGDSLATATFSRSTTASYIEETVEPFFSYAPGGSLAGATVARSTTASYVAEV